MEKSSKVWQKYLNFNKFFLRCEKFSQIWQILFNSVHFFHNIKFCDFEMINTLLKSNFDNDS